MHMDENYSCVCLCVGPVHQSQVTDPNVAPLSDVSRRRQLLTLAEDLLAAPKVSVCLSLSLSTDKIVSAADVCVSPL